MGLFYRTPRNCHKKNDQPKPDKLLNEIEYIGHERSHFSTVFVRYAERSIFQTPCVCFTHTKQISQWSHMYHHFLSMSLFHIH